MFPCRPERHERTVRLGAATLPMQLHSCSAASAVFSLAVLDVADPAAGDAAARGAARAGAANLLGHGGRAARVRACRGDAQPAKAPRCAIAGKRPDGRRVVAAGGFLR